MIEETNVLMQDGQPQAAEEIVEAEVPAEESQEESKEEMTGSVKKRLGQQEKRHKREIRALQDQVAQMQQLIMHNQMAQQQQPMQNNADMQQQQPQQSPQGQQFYDPYREMDMRRLEDDFNRDIAKTAQKYEDFDDIVRDPRLPFTQSVSDILKVLDNPGEVIYALGNNLDELYRISRLSQHAQAKELLKLSKALTMKEKTAPKAQQATKVMGQLKGNIPGVKEQPNSPSYFRKMLRSRGK